MDGNSLKGKKIMNTKKFKDGNNKVHEIEEGFEHLLPGNFDDYVEINQAEADILTAPTPLTAQEINDNKDAQVEAELGGDNIRILVSIFKQIISDGTIASKTPDEIINQAKAARRNEL